MFLEHPNGAARALAQAQRNLVAAQPRQRLAALVGGDDRRFPERTAEKGLALVNMMVFHIQVGFRVRKVTVQVLAHPAGIDREVARTGHHQIDVPRLERQSFQQRLQERDEDFLEFEGRREIAVGMVQGLVDLLVDHVGSIEDLLFLATRE